jgi:hypothetical protein
MNVSDHETARRIAWDCYFAGIVSISRHPGSGKDIGYGPDHQRTVPECAEIADTMLAERDKRFKEPQ